MFGEDGNRLNQFFSKVIRALKATKCTALGRGWMRTKCVVLVNDEI